MILKLEEDQLIQKSQLRKYLNMRVEMRRPMIMNMKLNPEKEIIYIHLKLEQVIQYLQTI